MKYSIILLLISFSLSAQKMANETKHVYAGMIITVGTSELLQQYNVKPYKAILLGFGMGILAGASKELIYDKLMKRGNCDKFDFFNTAWGSLCGVAICIPLSEIRKLRLEKKFKN